MITLLHPSRGRPQKALETYNHWISKSSKEIPIEHVLSLDSSDKCVKEYQQNFPKSKIIISDNTCVVEATNAGAVYSEGDILIYLSDDFKCPAHWDKLIEAETSPHNHRPWLLKVNDCLQQYQTPVLTIPIVNRKLYERLGYFWHPSYKSMFVDEDLYWVCHNNGWTIHAQHLKFPHEHWCNGKAEKDETYTKSESNWNQGQETFNRRKAAGFPL